jgi:hypothetical protein
MSPGEIPGWSKLFYAIDPTLSISTTYKTPVAA